MPKFLKWFIIAGAVSFGLIIVLGIAAAVALPNFMKFQEKARQSEARSMLTFGYSNVAIVQAETEKYSDDPSVAFKEAFTCTNANGCFNYVYAIRRSCGKDSAGKFALAEDGVKFAKQHVTAQLEAIKQSLASLDVPCKDLKDGITIVAIGLPGETAKSLDVWMIDEKRQLVSLTAASSRAE
jgi:type II secretory pathway pseudopilin PulG